MKTINLQSNATYGSDELLHLHTRARPPTVSTDSSRPVRTIAMCAATVHLPKKGAAQRDCYCNWMFATATITVYPTN